MIPFILDTDTAQDDCVALLVSLLDADADLRAITMVAGNVGFAQQVVNAQLTLNAAGKSGSVPLYCGCTRPIARDWVSAENVHGDGTGGLSMDLSGLSIESEHGVDALIRLTRERPGELTIVCIGPLTNIAMATVKDPEFARNVKALYIMGGSNNGRGNITAAAEFNFYVDPEAAQVVFHAGFDITVVPWSPLTLRDAVFGRDRLETLEALDTPLSRFFIRICTATLAFDESVGIHGSTHPDSLTVSVLLHPELITASADYAVDIETNSALTLGYSAMSWGVHGLEPNARVVEQVDGAAFFAQITRMLALPQGPDRPFDNL